MKPLGHGERVPVVKCYVNKEPTYELSLGPGHVKLFVISDNGTTIDELELNKPNARYDGLIDEEVV